MSFDQTPIENDEWRGVLRAIVESEPRADTEPGRCIHVLGTLTRLYSDIGTADTYIAAQPIVDGRLLTDRRGYCDRSDFEAAGYLNAAGWEGGYPGEQPWETIYPFYSAAFIPAFLSSDIRGIEIDPGYMSEDLYYQVPGFATEIPTP